jgi:hypothetical protein
MLVIELVEDLDRSEQDLAFAEKSQDRLSEQEIPYSMLVLNMV